MNDALRKLETLERNLSHWLPVVETRTAELPEERLKAWRADPVLFAKEAFGIEPWAMQALVMMAVAEHHRVTVRSGHKVGKSLLVAILAWWWAIVMPMAGVIITAPTGRQVKRIIWKELRALAARARTVGVLDLPPVPKDPGTGIQWDDGRYIIGFSTDDTVNMGGFSGPALLFLVDEASGVDEIIYEAIRGNTAGGSKDDPTAVAKVVLTGNPILTSGTFYESFHRQAGLWTPFHISSMDTPNVQLGRVVVPGLATQEYIDESEAAFGGREGPLWDIRIAGDFPRGGTNTIITVRMVEAAHELYRKWLDNPGPHVRGLSIGVDVARFGDDDSVSTALRGKLHVDTVAENGLDTLPVANMVVKQIERLRQPGDPLPEVKVDVIGYGAGVASILRAARNKNGDPIANVVEVNASERSADPANYPNIRSQLWFDLARWLDDGGMLDPGDMSLTGELVAPTYKVNQAGQQEVEKKDSFKKRLKRSPDRADALALAVHQPVQCGEVHVPSETSEGFRYGSARGF